MCKGQALAMREMLLYTAVIVSLYDMQPPRGQSWEAPRTVRRAATRRPAAPIKVWISRRELPPGGREGDGSGEA